MTSNLPENLESLIQERQAQKLVQEMLALAQQAGADQAEVSAVYQQGLNIDVRQQQVDTVSFNRDKAIGITVYLDQKKGCVSTSDLSPASLKSAVAKAIDIAKYTEKDDCAGLASPELISKEIPDLKLYHPWPLQIEEAIELAKTCENAAFKYDKRITNSDGVNVHSHQGYHIYANTNGFLGAYPTSRHSLSCVVIGQDKKGMVRDYDYTVARDAQKLLAPQEIGESAARRTINRLDAQKIPTGEVPVIFVAPVATSLIGHFMSAISGGHLFRKTSFLLESLGKQIFPGFIALDERPHLFGALGSSPFDGDGLATYPKYFVEQGVVKQYVLGTYSARKLKMNSTANAGGVHNLYISTGDQNLEQLCAEMGRGLLVTELMGQGVNLVTGDYSRGASGYWIEGGKIQFPVHEITVASNLKDMFKNIVKVGNDVETRGNIYTGSIFINKMMVAGA